MAIGDEQGSNKRQEELRKIREESVKATEAINYLNESIKVTQKQLKEAGGMDFMKAANVGVDNLTKKMSQVTVETLKSAKARKQFGQDLIKAQEQQAQNEAAIINIQRERDLLNRDIAQRENEVAQLRKQGTAAYGAEMDKVKGIVLQAKDEEIAAERLLMEARKSGDQARIAAAEATLGEARLNVRAQENIEAKTRQIAEEKRARFEKDAAERQEEIDDLTKLNALYGVQQDQINERNQELTNSINKGKQLEQTMKEIDTAPGAFIKAFEDFAKITDQIPIIGPLFSAIAGDIAKSAQMFRDAKAEGQGFFRALGTAAMGFIKLGAFAAISKFVELVVKGALKSSKAIVTLNKSVAGSTVSMTTQMSRVTAAAAKFKVPLQEAVETIGGLNESLGTALDFTAESTNQAVKLANKYGVSGDAVAHLLKLSASNKDTLTETVDAVTGGVAKFNALNGVSISTKAIFEDIGSASATTLRNIGKSPDAIVRAAAAARSLGMSMEDINSAAESTLDFQSSMAAEMEAELMLGKELNLDRLRAAAATGDTATQAAEMKRLVMENAGAIGNNVLAQEKFAATLGISRDQYNEMLKTNDALSVLEGKSGAAQQANDKARKMSQEEIAKSVAATTGKLTDLTSKIDKFQENMALGANSFAQNILAGFDDGFIAGIRNIGSMIGDEFAKMTEMGFTNYIKSGSNVGKLLGILAVGGGAVLTLKAAQGLGKTLFGGLLGRNKNTYTADGRLRVDGGGFGDMGQQTNADMASSSLGNAMFRGNMFKYLGNNGGLSRTLNRGFIRMFGKTRFTKFMQTKVFNVLGKNTTMLGRAMNNLFAKVIPNSAKNLTKTFGTNNMSKILNQARGGNVKALSKVKQFVKPQFLKSALSKGMDPKVANTLLKSTTNLSRGARVMSSLGKVFTKGNIAAIAGGLIVDKIASSSKEKADKSFTDAAKIQTSNVIGFNANVSDLSDKIGLLNESAKSRGIEKAAGVGSAALTGAGIGSMVGSIIPGIGTAIGGAVGGVIGAGVGLYQQYFSKEAKENAKLEREARAEMLGITIEEEKLLRKKGVEEAVNLRLEEAAQAKEAASQMLQMDLASFAQMTAEEQNRHITKLNLSEQMMEELNNNIGTATADLSKVINEEAQKIEDNSFIGKTKKFFSNLFGGGDENVTKVEQTIDSAPIIKAASSDAQKIRNSVGASEKTIAASVAAAENRAQNIANKQAVQQNKDQNSQMRELQNQTALLYQYITNPQKSVIKMDSYKVGESLVSRY